MDAQRWGQVQSLFIAALDRPGDGQAAFLDEACAGEPELRQEVEALLRGHSEDRALAIEGRLLVDEREAAGEDEDPLLDTRVGPYRVVERIGRGGMGDVYRAVRDDGQYHQDVALKVVRPGLASPALLKRFRHEAEILGRLHGHSVSLDVPVGVREISLRGMAVETALPLPEGAVHEWGVLARLVREAEREDAGPAKRISAPPDADDVDADVIRLRRATMR